MWDSWKDLRFEPDTILTVGVKEVLVLARAVAEGRASGTPVELRVAHLWEIRASKATRMTFFLDGEEALAATGASLPA